MTACPPEHTQSMAFVPAGSPLLLCICQMGLLRQSLAKQVTGE